MNAFQLKNLEINIISSQSIFSALISEKPRQSLDEWFQTLNFRCF